MLFPPILFCACLELNKKFGMIIDPGISKFRWRVNILLNIFPISSREKVFVFLFESTTFFFSFSVAVVVVVVPP
jgi:hypothetical protein